MDKTISNSQRPHLTVIIVSYIILASIFSFVYGYSAEHLNPDLASYLRLAGHIVEGNFLQSVTVWWAPMITWCLAPFLYFNVDGLLASNIVMVLSGLCLILSSWFFTERFLTSNTIRFIVVLIIALSVSCWTVINHGLTPDMLFAALLILYFHAVTHPDILNNKKVSFLTGTIAGLAYLTKHYALPFFIVHFSLTLLLRRFAGSDNGRNYTKNTFKTWFAGVIAFMIISSPWIILLSKQYERFTFGGPGIANHSIMGPKHDVKRAFKGYPSFYGLHKPVKDYAFHTWEDPSQMVYEAWSPFENKDNFYHQLKVIKRNIGSIFLYLFYRGDSFASYPFLKLVVLLIPIILLIRPLNNEKKFLYCWGIITAAVYFSGFILTYAGQARYFYPIMIVLILLSFHFFEEFKNSISEKKDALPGWRSKLLISYVLIIFVLTFTLSQGTFLIATLKKVPTAQRTNIYRAIANQIQPIQFTGPYAIIGPSRNVKDYLMNLFVAYYLKKQFLGKPVSSDLEGITQELKDADAKSLLVFDNMEIVEKLIGDKRYDHIFSLKNDKSKEWNEEINIFALNLSREQ